MRSLETGSDQMARDPRVLMDVDSVPPDLDPDQGRAEARFERETAAIKRGGGATTSKSRRWLAPTLAGVATALGAAALWNHKKVRDSERKYPPIGRFLTVNGVRLHYIERGQGEPLVLIHGNGTMIQDFTVSGLVDR